LSDTFAEIKQKADLVRQIDLISVRRITGALQDKLDKKKWDTCKGVISVSGPKFMNWSHGSGGGGTIDLVLHLKNLDFKTAVLWLADRFLIPHLQRSTEINPFPT